MLTAANDGSTSPAAARTVAGTRTSAAAIVATAIEKWLGRHAEAVTTLERAMQQLSPDAAGPTVGLRRQMETDLATFRAS